MRPAVNLRANGPKIKKPGAAPQEDCISAHQKALKARNDETNESLSRAFSASNPDINIPGPSAQAFAFRTFGAFALSFAPIIQIE